MRISCIIITFCALLQDVTSKDNGEVQVKLFAPWPNTWEHPFMETAEFLNRVDERMFWSYLSTLSTVNSSNKSNSDSIIDTAVSGASIALGKEHSVDSLLKLLSLELSLRSYTPVIEQQRVISESLWTKFSSENSDCSPLNAWLVVNLDAFENTLRFCNVDAFKEFIESDFEDHSLSHGIIQGSVETFPSSDHVRTFASTNGADNQIELVVLNGVPTTPSFSSFYSYLENELVKYSGFRLVTRFMPNEGLKNASENTLLQGYGATLDIKNMEYITVDEKQSDKQEAEQSNENEDSEQDNINSVEIEQLKVSEIKDLGLQATISILKAKDPLAKFTDIVHNFPSRAKTISKVPLKSTVRKQVLFANQRMAAGNGVILINGIAVEIGSESFNLFALLDIVRREMNNEFAVNRLNLPQSISEKLFSAQADNGEGNPSQKEVRVNLRSGAKGSIIFLNNIEKDDTYASWPTSVHSLLTGQMASVRKNIYHGIFFVDAGKDEGRSTILRLLYFLEMYVPVRFGLVITSKSLINQAKEHIANGLTAETYVKQLEEEYKSNPPVYDPEEECDALCIAQLYVMARKAAGTEGGLTFFAHICQGRQPQHQTGPMSKREAIALYGRSVVNASGGWSASTYIKEAEEAMVSTTGLESAWKMTFYAAAKGMSAQTWTLNGIVYPSVDAIDRQIQPVVYQEQRRLAAHVAKGLIKDKTDVFKYILKVSNAVSSFSDTILKPNDEQWYIPIPLPEKETTHMDAVEELVMKANYIMNHDGEQPNTVTLWVFADFTTKDGLQLVHRTLNVLLDQYISDNNDSFGIYSRIAILPAGWSITDAEVQLGINIEAWKLWKAIHQLSAGVMSKEQIEQTKRVLEVAIDNFPQNEDFKAMNKKCLSAASTSIAKEFEQAFNEKEDTILSLISNLSSLVYEINVRSGAIPAKAHVSSIQGIFSNGRVIAGQLSKSDILLLLRRQSELEGSRVRDIIATNCNKEALCLRNFSDTIMATVSVIGTRAREERMELTEKHLAGLDSIVYKTKTENATFDVKVIVDPLSKEAQRISPVCTMLRDALGARIMIIFLPQLDVQEFPLPNFFRYVGGIAEPIAKFDQMPQKQLLTLKISTPEPWIVYAHDTRNLDTDNIRMVDFENTIDIEYELKYLLIGGQCHDVTHEEAPAGMQVELYPVSVLSNTNQCVDDPNSDTCQAGKNTIKEEKVTDTLVMKNLGYFQLKASPGVWDLNLAEGASTELFEILDTEGVPDRLLPRTDMDSHEFPVRDGGLRFTVSDFVGSVEQLRVRKRIGMEKVDLLGRLQNDQEEESKGMWGKLKAFSNSILSSDSSENGKDSLDTIHVFSIASGALYERFLRIMMVSVRDSTSGPVKFWLVENFLSPAFKASLPKLSEHFGFEYELVTYKWPQWLRNQTEKQRIIWGYKILFLDVLFPLEVPKVIYVDADQVVRADLRELWDMDLNGKPYAYTPFCDSREETLGFQFWRSGYWYNHLKGRPYHISALYVVDLIKFRQDMVGDRLRALYDTLSRDANSLSNLDQDLPNFAQHSIEIHSLPQEWLWCESWCSDSSKTTSKTIDLCNNPLHKEPKLDMAKRVISGPLFKKSWIELDEEIAKVIE